MGTIFRDSSYQLGLRVSLAVLTVVGAIFVLQIAWPVVQALIVAIVLAACLWPWVSRLSRSTIGPRGWRPPRVAATAFIYAGTAIAFALVFWLTLAAAIPEFDRVSAAYPQQTAILQQYLQPFRAGDVASGAGKIAEDVAKEATRQADQGQTGAAAAGPLPVNVGQLAVGLFGGIFTLGLVLIFTFFLLLDGDRFAQWLLMALPREQRPRARVVGQTIRDRVALWVVAEAAYVTLSGTLVFTGAVLIQLPSPWLYGVLAAFVAFLPGIGPAFSLVPAFIVALGLSTWQAIAVLVFALFVQILDNTLLVPRAFGAAMRLPAFVVILAVLLGTSLMGAWGALIATPVAVAIEVLVREGMGRSLEAPEA